MFVLVRPCWSLFSLKIKLPNFFKKIAPGDPRWTPKIPKKYKNTVSGRIFHIYKNNKFPYIFVSHFCSFPGGRGAPKYSKIIVGSFKIDGTTFSPKNTNFSKIPPKMNPTSDPRNHQNSKKATRSTTKKHRENNKKN